MDDDIDVLLQDRRLRSPQQKVDNPMFTAYMGTLLAGVYGLWTLFALPGFRRVPVSLKVASFLFAYQVQSFITPKIARGHNLCRMECLLDCL